MIYKQLFLVIAFAMVLGCAPITPYKAGSDQEVNAIKLKINQQEAVEIITNNVRVWWGYKNLTDARRRYQFESLKYAKHGKSYGVLLEYSGGFTVTPIGVSFKIHGETHDEQARIDEDEQFEFSEVRQILVDRDLIGFTKIHLKSNDPYWLMRADTKFKSKDIASEKKLLAALEILCPNLLK